ncbi:MAG: hypothetical protein ACKO8V_09465, partial [Actinomycetota bacterium]
GERFSVEHLIFQRLNVEHLVVAEKVGLAAKFCHFSLSGHTREYETVFQQTLAHSHQRGFTPRHMAALHPAR